MPKMKIHEYTCAAIGNHKKGIKCIQTIVNAQCSDAAVTPTSNLGNSVSRSAIILPCFWHVISARKIEKAKERKKKKSK